MFKHEVSGAPVTLQTRWLKVPAAVIYSKLSRARLYGLLSTGEIKSSLILSPGKSRGMRIVDARSIDAFLEGCTKPASEGWKVPKVQKSKKAKELGSK